MCGDVMEWFEAHGVPLKTEDDGRVFPTSDSSESIINCFLKAIAQNGIELFTQQNVQAISPAEQGWQVRTANRTFTAKRLVIATGSNPKIWQLLADLGHTIVPPVPSLFTFQTATEWAKTLSGIAVTATVQLFSEKGNFLQISERAPLLFTHKGFSGPAVLRASAWGARVLASLDYQCLMEVNFATADEQALSYDEVLLQLQDCKQRHGRKAVQSVTLFQLPKRLWEALLESAGVTPAQQWASLNKSQLQQLAKVLTQSRFSITGKNTFKEEFVTAGGIKLSEIDFKTYQSKLFKHLYLAGEVLDIDAVTGGFNFQNAWTGGYLISEAL